jgi:hypothetical protein
MSPARFKEMIGLVTAMVDAGFPGHDAPYPFPDAKGRLVSMSQMTPADILAVIKTMYGAAWASAIAPFLTVH